MGKQKSAKANQVVPPPKVIIGQDQTLFLETTTRYVVRDKNGNEIASFGELADQQDLSDTVQAYKDTHNLQSFGVATDLLETQVLKSAKATVGRTLSTGASMLCCSFGSADEAANKKKNKPA